MYQLEDFRKNGCGLIFDFEGPLEILHAQQREETRLAKEKMAKRGYKPKKVCCYHHFYRPGGCMKGIGCDFSHEWDPDRMPICVHFEKGNCRKGKDCMFRHLSEEEKEPCHAYERGFCPRGPTCSRKHVHHDAMCDVVEHYPWPPPQCMKPHARQDRAFWAACEKLVVKNDPASWNHAWNLNAWNPRRPRPKPARYHTGGRDPRDRRTNFEPRA